MCEDAQKSKKIKVKHKSSRKSKMQDLQPAQYFPLVDNAVVSKDDQIKTHMNTVGAKPCQTQRNKQSRKPKSARKARVNVSCCSVKFTDMCSIPDGKMVPSNKLNNSVYQTANTKKIT